MDMLDDRFACVVQGVGSAKTLGRVHGVDLQVGGSKYKCEISVVDSPNLVMLLGLDMMTNYGWSIDMKNHCIIMEDR